MDIMEIVSFSGAYLLPMLFLVFGSMYAIFWVISQRFPQILVYVFDRGVFKPTVYRTVGSAIVKDRLFALLMNDFEWVGDKNSLQPFYRPTKMLGFLPGGMETVYIAYMRHDYLFTLNKREVKGRPAISIQDGKKIRFSSDGILTGLDIRLVNEELSEKEVKNGKEIAIKAMDALRSNQKYMASQSPVMGVLYASLPLLLIVIAVGVMIYMSFNALGDSADKIMLAAADIVDAANCMGG